LPSRRGLGDKANAGVSTGNAICNRDFAVVVCPYTKAVTAEVRMIYRDCNCSGTGLRADPDCCIVRESGVLDNDLGVLIVGNVNAVVAEPGNIAIPEKRLFMPPCTAEKADE
jgi:hypothetical protein